MICETAKSSTAWGSDEKVRCLYLLNVLSCTISVAQARHEPTFVGSISYLVCVTALNISRMVLSMVVILGT